MRVRALRELVPLFGVVFDPSRSVNPHFLMGILVRVPLCHRIFLCRALTGDMKSASLMPPLGSLA